MDESKRKLAKHIEIVSNRDEQKLIIDGEVFPWYLSDKAPVVEVSGHRRDVPKVTITLIAESVSVSDTLDRKPAGDKAQKETEFVAALQAYVQLDRSAFDEAVKRVVKDYDRSFPSPAQAAWRP